LILPHLDAAYNLARFLSRDAAGADDIVQESFLRAFRAFEGYRGGDPKAWLLAIVRNCSLTWAKARRAETGPEVPATEELADEAAESPEGCLSRASEIEQVRRVIAGLPEPFRETLVLRELEDFSYRQIAQVLGVPLGTVMSRLARARQMLIASLSSAPPSADARERKR
jgi:RNA polymerase sigma-70 factor (ECF subfamily)